MMSFLNDVPGKIRRFFHFLVSFIYISARDFAKTIVPYSWQSRKDLTGEKVVITGSGGAFGRALALEFARLNCRLFLVDVRKNENEKTLLMCKDVDNMTNSVHIYTCDLSNKDDVYRCVDEIREDAGGPIDMLVLNAGVGRTERIQDIDDDMLEKTVRINALSHVWLTKSFLPDMILQEHGHIVSVSSITGKQGYPYMPVYSGSKFFDVGFIESLQLQLRKDNIPHVQTTVICPHFLSSGLFGSLENKKWVLPPLDVKYAAKYAVNAIRTESLTVIMPAWTYGLLAMRGIWSDKACMVLSQYMGSLDLVNDFIKPYKRPDPNNNSHKYSGSLSDHKSESNGLIITKTSQNTKENGSVQKDNFEYMTTGANGHRSSVAVTKIPQVNGSITTKRSKYIA